MYSSFCPKNDCINNWKCMHSCYFKTYENSQNNKSTSVMWKLFLYQCLKFTGSIDEQDSNLLTSEHDVISGVLREEFSPSYQAPYGPRSQTTRFI